MTSIIKLSSLIGSEARSRSTASVVSNKLNSYDNFIIDLSGITFVSRSFADELCEMLDGNKNLSVSNAEGITKTMLDTVKESRNHKRVFQEEDADILKINSMKELSEFFATF